MSSPTKSALAFRFVAVSAILLTAVAFQATPSMATMSGFTTGVLPPPPPGSTTTYNAASEPQIRSDPGGNLYISSENSIGSGTDAWRSTNGGSSYISLQQPNSVSSASGATGFAPGGGDTDLATAATKNAAGTYNVYVASLTVGSVTLSLSQDRGKTWTNDLLSATVPGDDREWVAAYGANTYYLSYHNIPTGNQIVVNEGTVMAGQPVSVRTYSAITDPAILAGDTLGNEIGNIAVDQKTGDVYQVFAGCPAGAEGVTNCQALNVLYVAVGSLTSPVAGSPPVLSFTDHVIYTDPHTAEGLDNNFPNIALDRAGNVYASWSNDHSVFVASSTDHGSTWSKPSKVNSGSATTAIFPWLAAGAAGKVDLTYYGTPAAENYQTCSTSSATDPCQTEPWYVFMTQNLKTLAGGAWSQSKVTPVVHHGGVCQGGIGCMSSGNDNRDLYDDFGIAVDPVTGMASIAYSDDQHSDIVGTSDAGLCAASQSNTNPCDHTDFALQIGGKGI